MRKVKGFAFGLLLVVTVCLLCGCGPEDDSTDDLLINVDVPFSTMGVLSTPAAIQLSGWFGETVTIDEDEYTVLNQKDIGTPVEKLQTRLIELGYLSNEKSASTGKLKRVTGKFDAATQQAVEKFEAAYGQTPSGVATELMQYYLYKTDATPYSAAVTATPTATPVPYATARTYRYLQRGDSGDDVKALQQRLYELGYLSFVSGEYDTATEKAVKLFGSAYYKDTNGNATIELQKALFSQSAKTYSEMLASVTPTPSPTPTADPYAGYTALKEGDHGAQVTQLQKRLRELGYMHTTADGIYGERTVTAVKKFEAAYGRPETGVATVALQAVLFSDDALRYGEVTPTPAFTFTPTPTPAPAYTLLSTGSMGEDVRRLQLRLIELGYLSGEADGEYGSMTRRAVEAFEQAYGQPATGVATTTLQQYLFSDSALPNPNATATPRNVGYADLNPGSYGQEVSDLQGRLMELGYYDGEVSGYYDEQTAEAVKLFEAAYGKPMTGIATSALQVFLYRTDAKVNVTPTPAPSYAQLQKGDKGDEVKRLQTRLVELGYLSGTVDGYYGEGTALAVRYFEAAYGRAQTGIATGELQATLYSSNARRNTSGNVAVSYSTLKIGDSGNGVTALQNRLIALGYMNGSASGSYNNRTVNAVKAFQKLMGLSVNGAASSELQQRLFSSGAKRFSEEKIVSVNKPAKVSASSTGVYESLYDNNPSITIPRGTQLTVLRTRGIWAEVSNAGGSVGYVMLSDLEYVSSSTPTPAPTAKTTSVNRPAVISKDSVTVYEGASSSARKMGTLNKGFQVFWVSTTGEWAQIRNNAGTMTGYVKSSQLIFYEAPSASGDFKPLSNGSTGDDVKRLQSRLKELDYYYGDIGGNYLTRTTAAVKLFQQEIGITADGKATSGLQDILFCSYAPTHKTYSRSEKSYSDMYSGRSDSAVTDFQNLLKRLGYLSSVSGTYDSATVKAVKQVQTKLGMRDTSGIATKELQAFLFKAGDLIKK
ncbi:MAG: peptidoglycan-binding protein [Clostridia bacterium]|nr:peptidoglycan-binding protein [Clostridia bacterium]